MAARPVRRAPEVVMRYRILIVLVSCLSGTLACGSAGEPDAHADAQHHHGEALGQVSFPVTCNAEAQANMNRAVAMLHSYWFPEAQRTFEAAAAADPGCGIAHWGVALSHFGNPMGGGSGAAGQAAGWAAAEKGVAAGARSDRDRAYIDAAVALFRDHERVDNRTRMRAYEQALADIVARHPDDLEATIFHAMLLVATKQSCAIRVKCWHHRKAIYRKGEIVALPRVVSAADLASHDMYLVSIRPPTGIG
jgi:hypothetical protein